MPTKKPRMAITLEPATKAVLDELAAVSGKPASTFVSELLNEASEAIFRPMIEALSDANDKKEAAWDVLHSALAHTQYNAAQLSLDMHEQKAKRAQKKPAKRSGNAAKK